MLSDLQNINLLKKTAEQKQLYKPTKKREEETHQKKRGRNPPKKERKKHTKNREEETHQKKRERNPPKKERKDLKET
jgi:hypothetical protein